MAAVKPGLRWHVGQLTTGRIWRSFEDADGSWANSFQYGNLSKLELAIPVGALNAGRDKPLWPTVRSDTAPPKAFSAVSYVARDGSETLIEAGPIWSRQFDQVAGTLSAGGSDLSTYFAHRKVFDWIAHDADPVTNGYATWKAIFEGPQLGLVAKRLVQLIQYSAWQGQPEDDGPNAWQSLPIVLPDDADLGGTTPATYSEPFYGYEMAWVHDKLKKLTERDSGPEIQFVPRFKDGDKRYIEWVMRIGVEADGFMLTQSGNDHVFDMSAQKSPVRNININENGAGWAWTVWGGGQGEAEARPVVASDSVAAGDLVLAAGYPFLETEVTGIDAEANIAKVREYVRARALECAAPREQWKLTVARDETPHLGQYRVGDMALVKIGKGHAYLPKGDYPMRILASEGSTGSTDVTLTLQERPSEVI